MSGIEKETEEKMKHAIEHLNQELKSIRTGRANASMLDNVRVEVYGTEMRLIEVAQVTSPEPRMLLVTPFDKSNTPHVAKGIERANLGFNPIADGNAVRLMIPAMDENKRKEMAKLCHKRGEEAKIGVRQARQDGNNSARRQKADGDLEEDQLHRIEKNIQELTDKYCKKVDELVVAKEKDVMTV
ncbi:MAG: ribosome recycling factor [Chlamydiia bacterium]|nr:ribosome recycling factor [Chlamydiia bacterium]